MDSRNGFSDSNEISNNSSTCCITTSSTETICSPESLNPDISALRILSKNLETIFESPDFDFFTDAKIVISTGREVPVHRCILSARSAFFKDLFAGTGKERGPKYELNDLLRDYEVGFDSLVAVLGYLYCGKVKPLPKGGVYVCVDDGCSHVACRPAVQFMVEILYVSFTFQVPELVARYQRHLIDVLDKFAADDILMVLFVADMCGKACEKLLERCIEITVKSDIDIVTLDKTLPQHLVKQIVDLRGKFSIARPETQGFPDKYVKRIHGALDSDDVELVRMLLEESHTNLDDAHALHYAVAYCDAKTTTELLDLGLADVNLRNSRGYTVLHVAAMRKEPQIIVSLLTKGARPSDLTLDGRKALQISKRFTRAADYYIPTEEGKASPKDRLCIEILEQAERRGPLLGEASLSLAMAGDDLWMEMLDLENRVALAKLLFPMEAKVIMDIAHVDGTSEFTLDGINTKKMAGAQRSTVDLKHLTRVKALRRTGNHTPEEQLLKRRRYTELQEVLSKAFHEDKEEFDRSALSSSSSSKSVKVCQTY